MPSKIFNIAFGVDGIMTDDPAGLREILSTRWS